MKLTSDLVMQAMQPSPWDMGKQVLYDLCAAYPDHADTTEVVTKISLVGRAYAAMLERGRRNMKVYRTNEDFYLRAVAPTVISSDIDAWMHQARSTDPGSPDALRVMVEVHGRLTSLLGETLADPRGRPRRRPPQKRSLASKYLHSHVPELFFIFDSRASTAMGRLGSIVGRASGGSIKHEDANYRKFAQKCQRLTRHCAEQWGLHMTPMQLDNLLLTLDAQRRRK